MDIKPKILVLDNYDSFTYNLVHLLNDLGLEKHTDVFRNDKISLEAVAQYDKILLSPGPGLPNESGIMLDLISKYANSKAILGVCLGHQAIAEVFGGSIYNLDTVFHGVTHEVTIIEKSKLFQNVENTFLACRYHSWSVSNDNLPVQLKVTAIDSKNRIMAFEHTKWPIFGLQFHPEAFTTKVGKQIIENWVHLPL